MRRIIEKHRHPRGYGTVISKTPPPPAEDSSHAEEGLTRLHIELATMSWTGTRQPTRCGRKPNAVGQSVVILPENSLLFTIPGNTDGWLIRAAINTSEGRTVVVVRDGNTVHKAKDCRLGGLLILPTQKRREARGILC
jgi:hypothetical protein